MNIWQTLLYQPLLNLLVFFYHQFGHNLGLAILGVTALTNILLIPLTLPSLKLSKKQGELKDEIEKLRKKHKDNKQKFAEEQMKLYQKHGVHPAQGCLPQILRIVFLIALYQAFRQVLGSNSNGIQTLNNLLYTTNLHINPSTGLNTKFLYLDLSQKDPFYILPILAGVTQFALSKIMNLSKQSAQSKPAEEKKENQYDMAQEMQKQMVYIMPVMTVFIMANLPSGLTLYWFLSTVMSLAIQLAFQKKLPWQQT